ncbi:hypothetical protein [Gordonia sp. (in: high G+C Gram-positive bacteria)]|uniref:hypothetical protein n=1 Tax=Gordonia sp. (in: high G+C Gram-positive bacteria) TaxID=84139 RepID=UPI003F989CB9
MNSDETSEPDSVDETVTDETVSDETGADDTADAESAPGDSVADDAGADDASATAADEDARTGEDADDDAIEGDEGSDEPSDTDVESDSPRHWAASLVLAVAVAALVAAIVCAGYFGYIGIRAYTVDSGREQMRVEAVDSAEQAMLNILTVDDKGVDEWQKRMKSSLTGDALKQAIDETSGGTAKQIEAAKEKNLTIKASIVRSATTELNPDEDTATVFVLSQATSSEAPDQPQPQSNLLSMVKDNGAWKADKIVPLTDITYYDDTATPQDGAQPATPQTGEQQQGGGN